MKSEKVKTIKIFLASSEELADERVKFGDFIRGLDDTYEIRGYRIKLFKWEDLPSGDDGRPKQEEYNDKVRECDMFVGLFHTKAGPYTLEEYDTAKAVQKDTGKPTVYVFCRELEDGEIEDPSLKEFKAKLLKDIRHYPCKYNNSDSLQLQFVLQLLKVENNRWSELKVENGSVLLGNTEIARMDNLQFAAKNEDYVKTQQEIFELHDEIAGIQSSLEKKQRKLERKKAKLAENPDDVDCQEDYEDAKEEVDDLLQKLQEKIDRKNSLKEEFAQYQTALFNVAKRVAQLQSDRITDRMRRAMDAFEAGRVSEANTILDEAEADAKRDFNDYLQSKEITEQKRQSLIKSIEELQLKASTMMADAAIPIEERIEHTHSLYVQADEMAKEIDYDQEDYFFLLLSYSAFLFECGKYKEVYAISKRQLELYDEIYGEEDPEKAFLYSSLSSCCIFNGKYDEAIENIYKAMEIIEKQEEGSFFTAMAYSYIANSFMLCEKPEEAMTCFERILKIGENIEMDPEITSFAYNGIGRCYQERADFQKALEYFLKSSEVKGVDPKFDAMIFKSLGEVYVALRRFDEAMEQFRNASDVTEKEYGQRSVVMAALYNEMAVAYKEQSEYGKALEYGLQALEIFQENQLEDSFLTAKTHNNIGLAYVGLGDYSEALDHFRQALDTHDRLGLETEATGTLNVNSGDAFDGLEDYRKAKTYYEKALEIHRKLGLSNFSTAGIYNRIGDSFYSLEEYNKALEYYQEALEVHERLGIENADTALYYSNMGYACNGLKKYRDAIEYRKAALDIRLRLGIEDSSTAVLMCRIGDSYYNLDEYEEALGYYRRAQKLFEELGIENNATANCYEEMYNAFRMLNKTREAFECRKKAVDIRAEIEDGGNTAGTYNEIGVDCFNNRMHREALAYFQKALEMQSQLEIEDSLTAKIHYNMCCIFLVLREFDQSLECGKKALEIYKTLGIEDSQTAIINGALGDICCMLERYEDALGYYEKALEIYEKLGEQFSLSVRQVEEKIESVKSRK